MTGRRWIVFAACLVAAFVNLLIFGIHHQRTWEDASQYDALAVHMVEGQGYSLDGAHFSAYREPGYPVFLAAIYSVAGVDNFIVVSIVQAILVGICAFVVYLLVSRTGSEPLGIVAGVVTALIPYYGFYSYEILSEIVFTFVLTLLLYICVRIAEDAARAPWYLWLALGVLCGYGSLVREQLLPFLPFLVVCYAVFVRNWDRAIVKGIVASCIVLACIVGAWVLYVHSQIGVFTVTQGRQELSLYIRADQADLSFSQLNEYAIDWVERSISGGQGTTFLDDHDSGLLTQQYVEQATTSVAVAQIERQSIATIEQHPANYLYGNVIEVMKLLYIEHDYTDSMNKYMRAAIYALLYAGALFGVWQLFGARDARRQRRLAVMALLFIAYNCALIAFFDAIPRYNTPYLLFYVVIAIAGISIYRSQRTFREDRV